MGEAEYLEETDHLALSSEDREIALAMRALSIGAPRLHTVETSAGATLQAAHQHITRTIADVEMFADDIDTAVSSAHSAVPTSRAHVIAQSVATLCRRFACSWRDLDEVTPVTIAQFNRSVRRLRATLEAMSGGP